MIFWTDWLLWKLMVITSEKKERDHFLAFGWEESGSAYITGALEHLNKENWERDRGNCSSLCLSKLKTESYLGSGNCMGGHTRCMAAATALWGLAVGVLSTQKGPSAPSCPQQGSQMHAAHLLHPGGAAVPELPLHPHLCDSQHPPTTNFVTETELQAGWLTSTTSSWNPYLQKGLTIITTTAKA